MPITISSDDPRSIKANRWLKVTVRGTGEVVFGIPSQCAQKPGRYYLVTASSCDCEDWKRNGLSHGRIGEAGYHGVANTCARSSCTTSSSRLSRSAPGRGRRCPPT